MCQAISGLPGTVYSGPIPGLIQLKNVSGNIAKISMPWKGSALLDEDKDVPKGDVSPEGVIPETYVPGRNIIFLMSTEKLRISVLSWIRKIIIR